MNKEREDASSLSLRHDDGPQNEKPISSLGMTACVSASKS